MQKEFEIKDSRFLVRYGRFVVSLILFIIFSALYITTRSYNFEGDGISYLYYAKQFGFGTYSNVHHLLFVETFRAIFLILKNIAPEILLSQITICIVGAAGIVVFFNILLEIYDSKIYSVLFSLLLGISYGYWFWATHFETYIFSFFFIICTLLFLLKYLKGGNSLYLILINKITL
jgi:hypothetical protein